MDGRGGRELAAGGTGAGTEFGSAMSLCSKSGNVVGRVAGSWGPPARRLSQIPKAERVGDWSFRSVSLGCSAIPSRMDCGDGSLTVALEASEPRCGRVSSSAVFMLLEEVGIFQCVQEGIRRFLGEGTRNETNLERRIDRHKHGRCVCCCCLRATKGSVVHFYLEVASWHLWF
jgi:hypothetical protein